MFSSQKIIKLLPVMLVFFVLFIFFTQVNPIIPWDDDDWGTIASFNRQALPIPGSWTAARILPEVSGPLAGSLAAFVVYPFTGDYVRSISLTAGFLLAIAGALFYYMLAGLFAGFSSKQYISAGIALLVMVLYFAIFNSKPGGNNFHMLWPMNLCTVFYYILPNILNSCLVCYLMQKASASAKLNIQTLGLLKFSLLLLAVYYAIFSMLWSGVILAVYIFYEVVFSVRAQRAGDWFTKIKQYWLRVLKPNYFIYVVILLFFSVYCPLEYFSGRAANLADHQINFARIQEEVQAMAPWAQFLLPAESTNSYGQKLLFAFMSFGKLALQMNWLFILFSILSIGTALYIYRISAPKDKILRLAAISFLCAVSLMIFYCSAIALYGVVDTASRMESIYGAYFYGILLIAFCCLYILQKYPKVFTVFPLILSILFIETTLYPYSSSDMSDTSPQQKYRQTQVWLKQVQEADLAGKSNIVLDVSPTVDINIIDPSVYSYGDNVMGKTLHAHRITSQIQPLKIVKRRIE